MAVAPKSDLYKKFGGMETCRALAEAFFARVPDHPVLREVYPPHLRCAIEGVTLFVAQLLGGPCEYALQRRWTLSLREVHARFKIGMRERDAWVANMRLAIDDLKIEEPIRGGLRDFFERSSKFLMDGSEGAPGRDEIGRRWDRHLDLEHIVALIRRNQIREAIALAESPAMQGYFDRDRGALLSFLTLLPESATAYVLDKLKSGPGLSKEHLAAGRTLLHAVAQTGNAEVADLLLEFGADPNALDHGGHAPLYYAGSAAVVHALMRGGADLEANGGVKRCTALHMAARFGKVEVAEALLDCGASQEARDSKGVTPLVRAINCRKHDVAALLRSRAQPQKD